VIFGKLFFGNTALLPNSLYRKSIFLWLSLSFGFFFVVFLAVRFSVNPFFGIIWLDSLTMLPHQVCQLSLGSRETKVSQPDQNWNRRDFDGTTRSKDFSRNFLLDCKKNEALKKALRQIDTLTIFAIL
jgi:hypothetical protein